MAKSVWGNVPSKKVGDASGPEYNCGPLVLIALFVPKSKSSAPPEAVEKNAKLPNTGAVLFSDTSISFKMKPNPGKTSPPSGVGEDGSCQTKVLPAD